MNGNCSTCFPPLSVSVKEPNKTHTGCGRCVTYKPAEKESTNYIGEFKNIKTYGKPQSRHDNSKPIRNIVKIIDEPSEYSKKYVLGFSYFGKNNPDFPKVDTLDRARNLIASALNIKKSLFECRYSDFRNGSYYRYGDTIMIESNENFGSPYHDQVNFGFRCIMTCDLETKEQCDKVIEKYNSKYNSKKEEVVQ
jgi:hypothetical protein